MKNQEDKDFEEMMKQGDMFNANNGKLTCKTCAYAMLFKDSIVCGIWHSSFNINSFCDHYKTESERNIELQEWKEKQLADPNSLISRMRRNRAV